MDWASTKAMASGFVHRGDIDWSQMQQLALDDINMRLVVRENEGVATINLVASTVSGFNSGPLPANFARPRSALNAAGDVMVSTDIQGLMQRRGSQKYFAVSGDQVFAAGSSMTLIYSTRIAPLAADADHNALSDKYSPVLLEGLLKYATLKIQDFDGYGAHVDLLDARIEDANAAYVFSTETSGKEPATPYAIVRN